jgi:hypothetical protein
MKQGLSVSTCRPASVIFTCAISIVRQLIAPVILRVPSREHDTGDATFKVK